MVVSYKKLWKLLIDNDMMKKDLQNILNKSKKSTSKGYRLVSLSVVAIYFAD